MRKEILDQSDLHTHAFELKEFIGDALAPLSISEKFTVYVRDGEGRQAQRAKFECETLTDGSKVYNLIVEFED